MRRKRLFYWRVRQHPRQHTETHPPRVQARASQPNIVMYIAAAQTENPMLNLPSCASLTTIRARLAVPFSNSQLVKNNNVRRSARCKTTTTVIRHQISNSRGRGAGLAVVTPSSSSPGYAIFKGTNHTTATGSVNFTRSAIAKPHVAAEGEVRAYEDITVGIPKESFKGERRVAMAGRSRAMRQTLTR